MTKSRNKPKNPGNRHAQAEELDAFQQEMKDVTPLLNEHVKLGKRSKLDLKTAAHRRAAASTDRSQIELEQITQLNPEDKVAYKAPGIQHGVLRKLKRGAFPWEASLDLHGFTLLKAASEIENFIQHCQSKNMVCIQIIHGKGCQANLKRPVLKSHVSHWLSKLESVLAFCSALPHEGGTGAIYVLLKQQKP